MEILYNHNGAYETKDWAWLNATFGPGLSYMNAGGVEKFELVKIVVTEAEASLNAHVTNEGGLPMTSQPVALSWPKPDQPAVYLQDLRSGGLKTLWSYRGAVQYTDGNGQTGYGMSTDWYIKNMEVGGPGTMWVLSPSLPSDGITGLGMIGGTNHLAPTHMYFKITKPTSGSGGGNPPPEPSTGTVEAIDKLTLEVSRLTATLREAFRLD